MGVIALFLGAFRGLRADLKDEIRASEARQEKQVSELKKELSDALKDSEARQQKQMDELKKANEVLAGKLDPLPDVFFVTCQSNYRHTPYCTMPRLGCYLSFVLTGVHSLPG